jgi:hypothetical protein
VKRAKKLDEVLEQIRKEKTKVANYKRAKRVSPIPMPLEVDVIKGKDVVKDEPPEIVTENAIEYIENDFKKEPNPDFETIFFPTVQFSGLRSSVLAPQLPPSLEKGQSIVGISVSYLREDFKGRSGVAEVNMDGSYELTRLSGAFSPLEQVTLEATLEVGSHSSHFQMDSAGTPVFDNSDLGFEAEKAIFQLAYDLPINQVEITVDVSAKVSLSSGPTNSSNPDYSMGLTFYRDVSDDMKIIANGSYLVLGDYDGFSSSFNDVPLAESIAINLGVNYSFLSLEKFRFSNLLHYSENPFDGMTGISQIEDDLTTLANRLDYQFKSNSTLVGEISAGVSDSSPAFSLKLGIQYKL